MLQMLKLVDKYFKAIVLTALKYFIIDINFFNWYLKKYQYYKKPSMESM